jgi:hypothetical protein
MDAKMPRQERQPGVALASAERDRIGRKIVFDQSGGIKLTVLYAKPMHRFQFLEPDTHHASTDTTTQRWLVIGFGRTPASASASSAAARANPWERDRSLSNLRSPIADSGLKPLTSAPILEEKPLASNTLNEAPKPLRP